MSLGWFPNGLSWILQMNRLDTILKWSAPFSFLTSLSLTPSQALRQELAHASYLNMSTVILPSPRNRAHVADYARAVNACLMNTGLSQYMQFSVRIPVYAQSQTATHTSVRSSTKPGAPGSPPSPALSATATPTELDLIAAWETWDAIKTVCDYNPRLSLSESTLPVPTTLSFSADIEIFNFSARSHFTFTSLTRCPVEVGSRACSLHFPPCNIIRIK